MLLLVLGGCSAGTEGLFGQELYERACAACHGSRGQGSAGRPAVNAGSNAENLTDEQIAAVITVGPGAMPGFSRLSPEQLDSLVLYLRQLQGRADVTE